MDTTSTDILVILLSVGMSVVLLMTIVTLFYGIKILKSLRSITEKADHIAENVDNVSDFFRKSAGPIAFSKFVANIVETVKSKNEGKDKK